MREIDAVPSSMSELVRSIAVHVSGSSSMSRFQRLYRNDRVAFVYDILPEISKTITNYQLEIMSYYDEGYNRVAVRGPHGLGKTFLASILTHHSILTCENDGKVVTTASAWRQLEKYLWPEIHKISKKIYWTEVGRDPYSPKNEMFNLSIKLLGGTVEAFAVASDDHNTIEGAHGTRLVYIFDEAKIIPVPTWDAAEGAFSNAGLRIPKEEEQHELDILDDSPRGLIIEGEVLGDVPIEDINREGTELVELPDTVTGRLGQQHSSPAQQNMGVPIRIPVLQSKRVFDSATYEALAFAISTPGEPSGRFYDIHMHKPGYEDWKTRHVTIDEAIVANRISPDWVEQRRLQWGQDSSIFLNRVLGEFADTSEEGIIPLSWVRAAIERYKLWIASGKSEIAGKRTFGVDVARAGDDKTVIVDRMASVVKTIHTIAKAPLTQIAGKLTQLSHGHYIHIEMDGGLGAGVYDILRQDNVPNLRPIIVSGVTAFRDRSKELSFRNVRAAMWWNMRELLDPQYHSEICLPPDDRLTLDLVTPKWIVERNAVVTLENKDSIRARIGRSTDYGDACCLAFWMQSSGGGVVF